MNNQNQPPMGPGNTNNNEVVPYNHQNYTQPAQQQLTYQMPSFQLPNTQPLQTGNYAQGFGGTHYQPPQLGPSNTPQPGYQPQVYYMPQLNNPAQGGLSQTPVAQQQFYSGLPAMQQPQQLPQQQQQQLPQPPQQQQQLLQHQQQQLLQHQQQLPQLPQQQHQQQLHQPQQQLLQQPAQQQQQFQQLAQQQQLQQPAQQQQLPQQPLQQQFQLPLQQQFQQPLQQQFQPPAQQQQSLQQLQQLQPQPREPLNMPPFGSPITTAGGVDRSHIFTHAGSSKLWGYDVHGNSVAVKLANTVWMIEEDNGDLRDWYPIGFEVVAGETGTTTGNETTHQAVEGNYGANTNAYSQRARAPAEHIAASGASTNSGQQPESFPKLNPARQRPQADYPERYRMDNMMRTNLGPLTTHKSLRYVEIGGKKYRHYDVVTAKADHALATTLPLRPGKDPNQAPNVRTFKNLVCCNAGCGAGHIVKECKEPMRCKGCGATDHYWMDCPYWCQLCYTIRHVDGLCHYVPVGEDLKNCSGSTVERAKKGPKQIEAFAKGKKDCEVAIAEGYYEKVGGLVKKVGRRGLGSSTAGSVYDSLTAIPALTESDSNAQVPRAPSPNTTEAPRAPSPKTTEVSSLPKPTNAGAYVTEKKKRLKQQRIPITWVYDPKATDYNAEGETTETKASSKEEESETKEAIEDDKEETTTGKKASVEEDDGETNEE